ncbi:MAG: sigma-54-dependent transcriptional regulator [Candidatus Acidiferrales bacterium]
MKTAATNPPRVLVADDQPDVLEALRLLLKGGGYEVETAASPASLLKALERREFDALLMDLNYARDTTSGQEGLDLLARLKTMDSTLPVVVMTAWGSVDLAVEAMRRGARDFVQKPWDNARLLTTLRSQVELSRALRQGQRLAAENRLLRSTNTPSLAAKSAAMRRVLEVIHRVAPSDAGVLITGEHGVGKEVVARTLHALSGRSTHPMVTVNAGSIPEGIFESELFGHVKGAFTDARTDRVGHFELASGGTLFLDEIANVPLSQQAKLLRVIESREVQRVGSSKTYVVDARLVAATNASLRAEVAAGRFREDLLFRLNTIEIQVPPLRERREDVMPLANGFLAQFAANYRKAFSGFDNSAEQAMKDYSWPGNVRELNHVVERAVLMAQGPAVSAADLGLGATPDERARLADLPLGEVERLLIRKSLDRFGGNISHAAQALGLSRSALYRRLERYGIKGNEE